MALMHLKLQIRPIQILPKKYEFLTPISDGLFHRHDHRGYHTFQNLPRQPEPNEVPTLLNLFSVSDAAVNP